MKKTAFKDKWGEETSAVGFIPFPSTLIFAQAELKLTPMEVNVLLNLLVHWWEKDKFPYPSQKAIAYRIGVSTRTVQRILLDSRELLEKLSRSGERSANLKIADQLRNAHEN